MTKKVKLLFVHFSHRFGLVNTKHLLIDINAIDKGSVNGMISPIITSKVHDVFPKGQSFEKKSKLVGSMTIKDAQSSTKQRCRIKDVISLNCL